MKKILSALMVLVMLSATFAMLAVPTSAATTEPTNTFDALTYSATKVFTISTAEDLKAFFNEIIVNKKNFRDKTIKLLADIELNDTSAANWYENPEVESLYEVIPASSGQVSFSGTFDGQGYTIEGVYIKASYSWSSSIGFFPVATNAYITNFTMDGFYICNTLIGGSGQGYNKVEGVRPGTERHGTGALIGHAYGQVFIDGVTVKNGILTTAPYQAGNGEENDRMAAVHTGTLIGIKDWPNNSDKEKDEIVPAPFKILNTVVEPTVEIVPGEGFNGPTADPRADTTYMGGVLGLNYFNNNWSTGIVYDFTGSNINPANAASMNPVAHTLGNVAADAMFTIVEKVNGIEEELEMEGVGKDAEVAISNANRAQRLVAFNELLKLSGFYGSGYTAPTATRNVTWVVTEKSLTDTVAVGLNIKPSCPLNVERPAEGTTIFEFLGWKVDTNNDGVGEGNTIATKDLPAVTANVTYVAQYKARGTCIITFKVDGKPDLPVTYREGDAVSDAEIDTTKAEDDNYMYQFAGWMLEGGDGTVIEQLPDATGEDVTYVAKFDAKAKYKVTWIVDGKETVRDALEGQIPSYGGSTNKAADAENTYKFKGWTTDGGATIIEANKIPPVTGNTTYTAVYEATPKKTATNNNAATTEAPSEEKGGCKSMVSVGLITVMTVGLAGAVVARKKED